MPLTLLEQDELVFSRRLLHLLQNLYRQTVVTLRFQQDLKERIGYLEQLSTLPRMPLGPVNTSTEN